MALHIDQGSGWEKAKLACVDLRAPAFLCCPGPSLTNVTQDLRGPGRIVYAINSAYPRVKPDVWMGLDRLRCHHPRIWFEAFPKITRYIEGDTSRVRHCPNVFFAELENDDMDGMFLRRDHDAKFLWEHSSFLFALHFLLWRGHKEVYLVGCDMGGSRDYHDNRILAPNLKEQNRILHERQIKLMRRLAPAARRNGIHWISCTEGSPINDFLPYVPLEEAIKRCTKGMPDTRPLLHSIEADDLAEGKCARVAMTEQEKYQDIFKDPCRKSYGHTNHGKHAMPLIELLRPESVLDVGCGYNEFVKGVRLAFPKIDAKGVDFACPGADLIADATTLPFMHKEYDLLTAFDMLEHLLPEQVPVVLHEMARVSCRFIFSISYVDSVNRAKDGSTLHPTVRPESWWMEQISAVGGLYSKQGEYTYGYWSHRAVEPLK